MKCYAAYTKDMQLRMSGSSGGLFPAISLRHIQNQGVVYAAEYDSSFRVLFNRYETKEDLQRSFTSKYVQSRLNDTFSQIKKDLKNNLRVLFCGTPCQTTALRKYLKALKINSSNIIIINFICHGVPSEDVFLKYMERFSDPSCTSLSMRNKDLGWNYGGFAWKMTFSDGTHSTTPQGKVPYMRGFLSNLYLRPSCHFCANSFYKSADITLGDFWGIDKKYPEIPSRHGVSAVICRTEKGENVFAQLENILEQYPVQYEDIVFGNPCLEKPAKKPYYRKKFFKDFHKGDDLDTLISRMTATTYQNRILNKIYTRLPQRKTGIQDILQPHHRTIFQFKEDCCGCSACYTICPTKAISVSKDSEGFFYPSIRSDLCTNCHLCETVCPYKSSV